MKRLQPAVLAVLILAAHSVQAQTGAPQNRLPASSVYTDIVGELESSDDWIVQPDNQPEPVVFSKASSAQTAPPLLAPAGQPREIFALTPQRLPDWRRTEAGQLWQTPVGSGSDAFYGDTLRLRFGLDYLFFSRDRIAI